MPEISSNSNTVALSLNVFHISTAFHKERKKKQKRKKAAAASITAIPGSKPFFLPIRKFALDL